MFKELNYTTKIPLSDFLMHYEVIKNLVSGLPANAETSGYMARLKYRVIRNWKKPSSTAYFVEYLKMGNWASDSTYAFNDYNGCDGNGVGKDGAKGWGVGVKTVIISDCNFTFWYYKWKLYGAVRTGDNFTEYHPAIQTWINFRF